MGGWVLVPCPAWSPRRLSPGPPEHCVCSSSSYTAVALCLCLGGDEVVKGPRLEPLEVEAQRDPLPSLPPKDTHRSPTQTPHQLKPWLLAFGTMGSKGLLFMSCAVSSILLWQPKRFET